MKGLRMTQEELEALVRKPGYGVRMQHPVKACAHCGLQFAPVRTDHVYCSHRCGTAASYYRKPTPPKHLASCAVCDSSFDRRTSSARYCSAPCRAEADRRRQRTGEGRGSKNWKRRGPPRTCEKCGKQFHAPPSLIARGGGRFCSYACRGAALRGEANANWKPRITVTCAVCAKESKRRKPPTPSGAQYFCKSCRAVSKPVTVQLTAPVGVLANAPVAREAKSQLPAKPCEMCGSPIRGHGTRFCSIACRARATKTGTTVPCEICGKAFYVIKATLAAGFGRFCSQRCFGAAKAKLAPANAYSRCKGGRRQDLNNMYFRSRWEANYARYLNFLQERGAIARWEYEHDTFEFVRVKRGSRFYTPDFKVFALDGSHQYEEVKGWLTPKGRTKLKRMLLYFPNERVLLIDQPVYRAVARQVAALLPHWETDPNKGRYL